MTEKRKRQKLTPEFKSDAVKLAIENNYTGHEVARRLEIGSCAFIPDYVRLD